MFVMPRINRNNTLDKRCIPCNLIPYRHEDTVDILVVKVQTV